MEQEYERVEDIYGYAKDSTHQTAYEALEEKERSNRKSESWSKEVEHEVKPTTEKCLS